MLHIYESDSTKRTLQLLRLERKHFCTINVQRIWQNVLTVPPEGCSCKRELDGADGFTFEEFGVGSDTEGF